MRFIACNFTLQKFDFVTIFYVILAEAGTQET